MKSENVAMKKVVVLIPCHNEADGIADVLKKFPYKVLRRNHLDVKVMVIDNCSTDNTAEIAAANGATVLIESKKGKGNAMRAGFNALPVDTDYVVMLDGDDTYDAGEITRMIEPLENK